MALMAGEPKPKAVVEEKEVPVPAEAKSLSNPDIELLKNAIRYLVGTKSDIVQRTFYELFPGMAP